MSSILILLASCLLGMVDSEKEGNMERTVQFKIAFTSRKSKFI